MVFKMVIRYTIKIFFAASFITGITQILELSEIIFFCLHSCFFLYIEMNNNIHTVQSESSGIKMTRFQIEGWLELIGTPSVDILHALIRLCLALLFIILIFLEIVTLSLTLIISYKFR